QGTGVWRDGCFGATFDAFGHRLYGPAPRDLDRYLNVEVDGHPSIDTGTLYCGPDGRDGAGWCEPLPGTAAN
ncbi:MAG: hypothetical protein ACM3S1_15530, partial [Hyphomicrobiales bacterium]